MKARDYAKEQIHQYQQSMDIWLDGKNADNFFELVEACHEMIQTPSSGRKIVFFGNGGSAAEAMHLAAEFAGKCVKDTGPKPAMSLSDSNSAITAIGNDFSFDEVFSRQIQGICNGGDIVIGLSTSGASTNVIKGLEAAIAKECLTSIWTSTRVPQQVVDLVKWPVLLPLISTPRIQEGHLFLGHLMSEIIEMKYAFE